ncbi:biotin-dependent carboxyltransferase family protein [Peribacillus asahii]|uniref:5-oxoprolinase subunit C family protein n=1 Tax=Peribacillus asahii TaxID=228899 RepID=UPI002079C6FE|nr:biotin-dependent carboxyltransferase family protein [Peribacillus asahii]USK58425.1 biotin-dependent carboxyltransferase family protein [Peribacillus asahii]
MSLRVIKPGLLTTIQDLGRKGFQKHGVIVSGAMDTYSLRIANLLVGNQEGEAALEVTLMGPTFKVEEDCVIAITGGDLSPIIDERTVPMWRPVYVKKGAILRFGRCKSGCRAYLSVAGGYAISEVLGSKSTYLRGQMGGYKGRALQVDDVVPFNGHSTMLKHEWTEGFLAAKWFVHAKEFLPSRIPVIRFLAGSQYEYFTNSSKLQFVKNLFKVSSQSDRMGYRISGPALELQHKRDILSEAVSNGSIQVPPDGNPIILLADRQTTGGYPKIAQVITTDLSLIGQLKPGESIQFSQVTLKEAEQLYIQKEQKLKQLKVALSLALQ